MLSNLEVQDVLLTERRRQRPGEAALCTR